MSVFIYWRPKCFGKKAMLWHLRVVVFFVALLAIAFLVPNFEAVAMATVTNHLLGRSGLLSQSFCALRHGQSLANVAKIISSDPWISTVEHGLSDLGKEQARKAGSALASLFQAERPLQKHRGVALFSSDFKRAKETAEHVAEELGNAKVPIRTGGVVLETRLRERFFGELNGGPDSRYQDVWDIDARDPSHEEFGVESCNSVLDRTTKLVHELDRMLEHDRTGIDSSLPWKCILVAHGDVLQILQTGFLGHKDASLHRSLEHLETATVRDLILAH
eukprot:TRINITY_DN104541_c0_g1_i1.p1 TRINITY_DN104541_c0_g1~~TRINITY_DN104541_c0_g1_i1.p1  ORF type:complete len:276 (+),score=37.22 TRINITY_DN104541_c0_g1_i1:37-864(+)